MASETEYRGALGAALEVQRSLEELNYRFCFIGGLVVSRWGDQRYTRDADLSVLCPIGDELPIVDGLASKIAARIDNAREFALERRIYLGRSTSGTPVDISLGVLDFEQRCIARSSFFSLDQGQQLRTCSAEDLIVYKAFAARPQDWLDIEGILIRQQGKLNWDQILQELRPLAELKEAPELVDKLLALRKQLT